MIASSVRNPVTQIDYFFPKAQQKIQVTDQRRVSLMHVPGGDGAYSAYGSNPFPRGELMVTISFRVTPKHSGTTFSNLRNLLNLAVDHGQPQTITFLDDNGNRWLADAILTGKNLDVNNEQQWSADWSLTYVVEDALAHGLDDAVPTWGGVALTWGMAGLVWGATPHQTALTTRTVNLTIPNPNATAETRDMIFTILGTWGPDPAIPGGSFSVINSDVFDIATGAPVQFTVHDLVRPAATLQIDCGSGGVWLNGTPQIGYVTKAPLQYGFMRFRAGGDNHLIFQINGTPNATLSGGALIAWQPKYSLS